MRNVLPNRTEMLNETGSRSGGEWIGVTTDKRFSPESELRRKEAKSNWEKRQAGRDEGDWRAVIGLGRFAFDGTWR